MRVVGSKASRKLAARWLEWYVVARPNYNTLQAYKLRVDGEAKVSDRTSLPRRPPPDLIDVFIILLLSAAIDIFIFTIATQAMGRDSFQHLPDFLMNTYSSVWTSVASGAAGIGLVIVKSLGTPKENRLNYMALVLMTAIGLLAGIFAIALATKWMNSAPVPFPPQGVSMIDIGRDYTDVFDFESLPGAETSFRIKGIYSVKGRNVVGHMTEGFFRTSDNFHLLFPMSLTKLSFRSCYIHPISFGTYQMDAYPFVGKSSNSEGIGKTLDKNRTYQFAPMDFSFQLADDAKRNLTWLCAAIENSAGYFPAQ